MNLDPVVPPAVALALDWDAEVKSHLRLDSNEERPRVDTVLVPAATQMVESLTGRAMTTQTWKLQLDAFPADGVVRVPKAPLRSVTHIKYYDTAGVLQTLSASTYEVSAPTGPFARPGRIQPAYGQYWPPTRARLDAVEIQFVCGYGADPEDVPPMLRAAMLIAVSEMFERREDAVVGTTVAEAPISVRRLVSPFALVRFDA